MNGQTPLKPSKGPWHHCLTPGPVPNELETASEGIGCSLGLRGLSPARIGLTLHLRPIHSGCRLSILPFPLGKVFANTG